MMDIKGPEVVRECSRNLSIRKRRNLLFHLWRRTWRKNKDGHRRVDVNYPDFYRDIAVGIPSLLTAESDWKYTEYSRF